MRIRKRKPTAQSTKVYLAGRMTGLPNYNFPQFNEAAGVLRSLGYKVINPAENPDGDGYTWEKFLKLDIRRLVDVDAVVCLPRWYESKGASFEVFVANVLGIPVLNYKTMLPIHPEDLPQHEFYLHQPKENPKTLQTV